MLVCRSNAPDAIPRYGRLLADFPGIRRTSEFEYLTLSPTVPTSNAILILFLFPLGC